MSTFTLHPRLQQDCHQLREFEDSILLLMDNAHYLWLVLVPKTDCVEWYQLSSQQQTQLNNRINALSQWLKEGCAVDKLNTAIIGNIVEQMHIHIIGRKHDDVVWPAVVWGRQESIPYTAEKIQEITQSLPF